MKGTNIQINNKKYKFHHRAENGDEYQQDEQGNLSLKPQWVNVFQKTK
jgi:hypothetical protein